MTEPGMRCGSPGAAGERGQAQLCPQRAALRSLLPCGPRKGARAAARAPCGQPLPPLPAPLGSSPVFWGSPDTPSSAHPLHPSLLHRFALPALAQAASSSLSSQAQQRSCPPCPRDPKFSPTSGALPAPGFSWGCCREGSRGSVLTDDSRLTGGDASFLHASPASMEASPKKALWSTWGGRSQPRAPRGAHGRSKVK